MEKKEEKMWEEAEIECKDGKPMVGMYKGAAETGR